MDLKGVFLCSQAAAPLLRQSGRGRIVNLSSDAGKVGFPNIAPYVAAKHGVIGLTKSLAAELAPSKVTVNCICPVGTPETTMGQDVLRMKVSSTGASAEQLMDTTAANVPLGRSGTVADVVHIVMFLLSDEAAFLTGGTIDVDGGLINTVAHPRHRRLVGPSLGQVRPAPLVQRRHQSLHPWSVALKHGVLVQPALESVTDRTPLPLEHSGCLRRLRGRVVIEREHPPPYVTAKGAVIEVLIEQHHVTWPGFRRIRREVFRLHAKC